jgi:hypothetical protein
MIFDLIRNGKAPQYQSAIVTLRDGKVDIDLTGAASGRGLAKPGRRRPRKHLRYQRSALGDLRLYVRSDQLFLDIKRAIEISGIILPSDLVTDVARPDYRHPHNFTVADLECSLKAGKHKRGQW